MKFVDDWTQYNEDWEGIGYPHTSYTSYLEEQVAHWRQCALAKYDPVRVAYTDKEIIENLQVTVNALYFENVRLRKLSNGGVMSPPHERAAYLEWLDAERERVEK